MQNQQVTEMLQEQVKRGQFVDKETMEQNKQQMEAQQELEAFLTQAIKEGQQNDALEQYKPHIQCLLSGYNHYDTMPAAMFDMVLNADYTSNARYVSLGDSLESLSNAEHMYVAHSIRAYQMMAYGGKYEFQMGNAVFWQFGSKYFMPCCGLFNDSVHDPAAHIKLCLTMVRQKRYLNAADGHYYVTPVNYQQSILSTFNQPFLPVYKLYNITYLAAQLQTKICVCTDCQRDNNKCDDEIVVTKDTASDIAIQQEADDSLLSTTTCVIKHQICNRPNAKKICLPSRTRANGNNGTNTKARKKKKNNQSNNGQRNGTGIKDYFKEYEEWCQARKQKWRPPESYGYTSNVHRASYQKYEPSNPFIAAYTTPH
jgi:hypothetical protein